MIKRSLSILLVLIMLFSAAAFGQAASADAAPTEATVYTHDGRVTFVDGALTDEPILSFDDAGRVVAEALDTLGGGAGTTLEPWRNLKDAYGNQYFVFQQMYDDTTVLGGAVKVITDGRGNMIGLTSSIVSDVPEASEAENISAEAAEALVLQHEAQTSQRNLTLLDGATDRMILPIALNLDVEAEDDEGSRYVWVVYTDNPDSRADRSAELPYLAHYVTMEGEYLYSLPTILPGDEAGASGFNTSYLFEFMESVDYTGFVDLSTGGEKEITVSVMRDTRTGMYYLGNLERRIVVANCWDFLYDNGRVVLEYSPDNLEWDQVGLLSLYNYCRAYDYYREIGWLGGDGEETPILILNNFCDINHQPIDNAAYAGKYLGWQIFLSSRANDFAQCLDILAHEFTHCVTQSVMTYNAYMNDFGAINEAMSDIQGKTCQLLLDGGSWMIGDQSKSSVRSMSEPHKYGQPEYTWDLYYTPTVKTPTTLNDRGGVHTNSSLLNVLAWYLYEQGGMTLEEGRAFWFTVDCAMVPGTDYAQLAELLPWALRAAGLTKYEEALSQALAQTRLGDETLPTVMDADRALLTLNLPENSIFGDEQWIMYILSVNPERLVEAGKAFVRDFKEDGIDLFSFLTTEDSSEVLGWDVIKARLREWLSARLEGVLYSASTNAGQDGLTMRMVSQPGFALPVLLHGVWNDTTSEMEQAWLLIYLGGEWIDLTNLGDPAVDEETGKAIERMMNRLSESLGSVQNLDDALSLFVYKIEGGVSQVIPGTGLEGIRPTDTDLFSDMSDNAVADAPLPRKSRPKLPDETEIVPEPNS